VALVPASAGYLRLESARFRPMTGTESAIDAATVPITTRK
jgi:hypothetical protein